MDFHMENIISMLFHNVMKLKNVDVFDEFYSPIERKSKSIEKSFDLLRYEMHCEVMKLIDDELYRLDISIENNDLMLYN